MTKEEREELREVFVKYQLLWKLKFTVSDTAFTDEEAIFYSKMMHQHPQEYAALWHEVATEYNGDPFRGDWYVNRTTREEAGTEGCEGEALGRESSAVTNG